MSNGCTELWAALGFDCTHARPTAQYPRHTLLYRLHFESMQTSLEDFGAFLSRLRLLLDPQNLPTQLPLRDGYESKYAVFLNFELDPEILEKTEGEVATVSEQFKGVFGWQARTTGDGIIPIEERGSALSAVVDVLRRYHEKHPQDAVLQKWAYDLGTAAEHVYSMYNKELPVLSDAPPTSQARKRRRRASSASVISDTQDDVKGDHPDAPTSGILQHGRSESRSSSVKGRPPKELMNRVIQKGTMPPNQDTGKAGSPYWTTHPDAQQAVVRVQSQESLGAKIGRSQSLTQSDEDEKSIADSIRRSSSVTSVDGLVRTGPAHSFGHSEAIKRPKLADGTIDAFVELGARQRRKVERDTLQKKADHLIMRLICVCGLVPNILDTQEWKDLMQTLNSNYTPSSSSKFTYDYIPKEAAFVRSEQMKELKWHENLTITFDGNSTRRDSIYFVHATTPEREHFFVDGHIGTDKHHTVSWVKSKVMQVSLAIPTIFDLRDCCHHLHNIIGDITSLPAFKAPIADMKKIVAHFSKSTFGRAMLRQQEDDCIGRLKALQKVGKTRFGSHWSAAQSLLPALPKIRELAQNKEIKFKDKRIQALFMNRISMEYTALEHALVQYTTVVNPLVRSLWALEASAANAADVWIFFTACAATLRQIFNTGTAKTGIPEQVAEEIIEIFNERYDEFFFHNDIYFAAFALDPRYPVADYLLLSPTANPSITVPRQGTDLTMPHPRAYDRMKEFVKKALRDMLERVKTHPDDYHDPILVNISAKKASQDLKNQLEAYWKGEYPFNEPICPKDPLAYWTEMKHHSSSRILAVVCIKIFSVLANSMPDERTGSKFTWFNSALRGKQKAQTLIDMVQIGQYWLRKRDLSKPSQGNTSSKTFKRPIRQPIVKFRDINKDLLNAVQNSSWAALAGHGDPDKPQLLPESDMNLSSPHLLDILSDTPYTLTTTHRPEMSSVEEDSDGFADF
ncbi:ribonuclease H-like domain-containing protein [Trametes meyenii]|nr:ribonuclease H-like domain-containing protein [Trametes meyenii]